MSSIPAPNTGGNDPSTIAQLDAASQLLAAANLLQQQNNSDNCSKAHQYNGSSALKASNNGNSAAYPCSLCGANLPSAAEFQSHFHSHQQQLDTMLAPGQFNYGMHLLNLLQNSRSSANNSPSPSLAGIPSPTPKSSTPSTTSGSANVRKRKLLASQATLEALQEHESTPPKTTISPKNGTDLAQNLLAQFANEASKAQHLSVSVVGGGGVGSSAINGIIPNGKPAAVELSNGAGSPLQAYPCTSCHKTFATEVDLKAHTLRHLTQHPFVCYSCGKGFKYNHSLHFHIKQYHNGGVDATGDSSAGGRTTPGAQNATKDRPLSLRRPKKPEIESNDDSDDVPLNLHRSTPTAGQQSSLQSSELYQRLTLMDENHNTAGSAEKTGSDFSVSVGLFGKPPTNLPADSSIQIRSEKVLATVLEAINVHTDQSVVLYKCCLCAVAFATLDQLSIHVSNVHPNEITPADSMDSATPEIVCEKCSAKFSQQNEYEIHMQLHRSLEASQSAVAAAAATSGQGTEVLYPFSLLSHLTSGSAAAAAAAAAGALANGQTISPGSGQAPTIDFRHIMASASKDTDFGRKFAAQLLAGDSDSGRHSPASASSSNKAKSQDSNNNSLMFLVPEPSKPPTSRSQYVQQFKDMNTRLASVAQNTKNLSASGANSGSKSHNSTASSNNNGLNLSHGHPIASPGKASLSITATSVATDNGHQTTPGGKKSRTAVQDNSKVPTRNLKEPVDIFEGAGQSLPIQKFSIGDIQETSPGVFKCRFCDKCFDRVFSVHRHERVHTGFKPCICKTCGRGFSEKRNLRHHIIRFHSDGSGRDLLKRKRNNNNNNNNTGNSNGKSQSANISNSEFLSHYDRMMAEASGNGSVSSNDAVLGLNDSKSPISQSALHMSLAMLDRIKQEMQTGSDSEESQPKMIVNRRKSATKPPQKLEIDSVPASNGDPDSEMTSDEEEYSLRIDSSAPKCNIKVEIDSEL